jgi:hypothetical protein
MVEMLCIWRSGIGVSVSGCMFGGMGIYIQLGLVSADSNKSALHTNIKQSFLSLRSGRVIATAILILKLRLLFK